MLVIRRRDIYLGEMRAQPNSLPTALNLLEPTEICQSSLAIPGRCPADQYQHFYHSNLSQAPKLDLAKT